jgi:uncharacterized OB-fold protein
MTIPVIDRLFPVDPSGLLPAITDDNKQYWDSLTRGELVAQACNSCDAVRYPIAPVCPQCGSTDWNWKSLSGEGRIFSWVRFQRPYLPEFQDVMPYAVASIQLREGPRMYGRLVGDSTNVSIGAAVSAVIEKWPDGRCVPAFEIRENV